MDDFLRAGKLPQYCITKHLNELSLAISPWVLSMRNEYQRQATRKQAQGAMHSPVYVVSKFFLAETCRPSPDPILYNSAVLYHYSASVKYPVSNL